MNKNKSQGLEGRGREGGRKKGGDGGKEREKEKRRRKTKHSTETLQRVSFLWR